MFRLYLIELRNSRWIFSKLRVWVFIINEISNSYKLLTSVAASKEDYCNSKRIFDWNLVDIRWISLNHKYKINHQIYYHSLAYLLIEE